MMRFGDLAWSVMMLLVRVKVRPSVDGAVRRRSSHFISPPRFGQFSGCDDRCLASEVGDKLQAFILVHPRGGGLDGIGKILYIEFIKVLLRKHLLFNKEFLARDDGNPEVLFRVLRLFVANLSLLLARVLQQFLVIPKRKHEVPDSDANIAQDRQQLRLITEQLTDVQRHFVFLVVEEDAEVGPFLTGVALVRSAVHSITLKAAVALDFIRDVLITADRLGVAQL